MTDRKGMGGHQSAKSVTDVWLTPPHILNALGGANSFDLDPCAPLDRPWDMAKAHFTIEDDGLAQDWWGRVFLNPPYASGVIGKWLEKMAQHGTGMSLVFARTETAAFHRTIWERCDAIMFLEGRLHFHHADGTRASANAGAPSVICAYGPSDADILSQCGINGQFVPLRLRAFAFGFETVGTWADEVIKVVKGQAEPITVSWLYRALADSPKSKRNPNWKAKIRQTLQRGPFEPLGSGKWQMI